MQVQCSAIHERDSRIDCSCSAVEIRYLFTGSLIELMQDFRSMGDSTFRFVAGFVNGILGWFGLSGPSYARLAERVGESAVSRYGDS